MTSQCPCDIGASFSLFAYLCYPARNLERSALAIHSRYGDFGLSGATIADRYWEGGAVYVAGSTFFDDLNLDRVEGEEFQRKTDLMAVGYCFAIVCINEIPCIRWFSGKLLN